VEATGSMLTNKYAEGYPGRRYYGGCEYVDDIERLAVKRAKEIFGSDHANVQAHAGSQANMAAYFAMVKPGATIMAMDLVHGGHLTHGSKVNFSGRMYNIIPYGVKRDDCRIDYEELSTSQNSGKLPMRSVLVSWSTRLTLPGLSQEERIQARFPMRM